MEQRLSEWPKSQNIPGQTKQADKAISTLENQVEEQRQLRLQDARQVEAKAAKIKEWVTNKLRELEEQNQVLREQNIKCNQQLELLRNHIATQSNRNSIIQPVRSSLSLDVENARNNRRRSESLDTSNTRPVSANHRRNLSMEPHELARDLAAAVDGLNLIPLGSTNVISDSDTAHDYAEIYTPSREKVPIWIKGGPPSTGGSSTTSESVAELGTPRPPTPPLHRFPSWEAKIYQVANDGLAGDGSETQEQETVPTVGVTTRQQQTASGGYCDISVPVYATVKGRASQIRSMPFTGESSDDSSDGEDHAVIAPCATATATTTSTHNSHNSSSTDNTETSTSGSASSPSKSLKTSSSLSPAKRNGCESPKTKIRGECSWEHCFVSGDWFFLFVDLKF